MFRNVNCNLWIVKPRRVIGFNRLSCRYCGDGLSKIDGGTLRGQGPLIIGFKSDESDNLKGFQFSFECK